MSFLNMHAQKLRVNRQLSKSLNSNSLSFFEDRKNSADHDNKHSACHFNYLFYFILNHTFSSVINLPTFLTKFCKMNSVSLSKVANDHLNRNRKRKLNVDQWKTNAQKILRNSGQAYVSRSTGDAVP